MIKIKIKPSIIKKAKEKSEEMGRLKNSITKGKGNVIGFIGELIVADFLGAREKNTYDFDLIHDDLTYDVKTKSCTSEPRLDYECSVAAFNIKQKCDYYVFVRVLESLGCAWILGFMNKEQYFKKARFCEEGKVDSKSSLGWKFKADCYNLEIRQLRNLEGLK